MTTTAFAVDPAALRQTLTTILGSLAGWVASLLHVNDGKRSFRGAILFPVDWARVHRDYYFRLQAGDHDGDTCRIRAATARG